MTKIEKALTFIFLLIGSAFWMPLLVIYWTVRFVRDVNDFITYMTMEGK